MSSVRPMLDAERRHGSGEPHSVFTAFFGATFGVMTHLNMYGLTTSCKWFPNRQAKLTGYALIGGGLFGGYFVGRFLFGDASLRRLAQH